MGLDVADVEEDVFSAIRVGHSQILPGLESSWTNSWTFGLEEGRGIRVQSFRGIWALLGIEIDALDKRLVDRCRGIVGFAHLLRTGRGARARVLGLRWSLLGRDRGCGLANRRLVLIDELRVGSKQFGAEDLFGLDIGEFFLPRCLLE